MSMSMTQRMDRRTDLALAAACALLFLRPLIVGGSALTIPLLALIYCTVLVLSRPARAGVTAAPALVTLALGVAAVIAVRVWLAGPFSLPTTVLGAGVSVLAAIAEEALFRGALFARLLARGRTVAIVGSAVAFALLHLPFYGLASFPLDLGAGLLFSWQRSESGSWTVPAATHALANLLAVLP